MNEALCGTEKGYLFRKKDVDEKLVKAFPILAGKLIYIDVIPRFSQLLARIFFSEYPKEDKKTGYFLEDSTGRYSKKLLVLKSTINDMLDIQGNIDFIDIKLKTENDQFVRTGEMDEIVDPNRLYYFITTGEQEAEWIKSA